MWLVVWKAWGAYSTALLRQQRGCVVPNEPGCVNSSLSLSLFLQVPAGTCIGSVNVTVNQGCAGAWLGCSR
jgi:hypothetical protein